MGVKDKAIGFVIKKAARRIFKSEAQGGKTSKRKVASVLKMLLGPVIATLVVQFMPDISPEEAGEMAETVTVGLVAAVSALIPLIGGFLDWKLRDDEDRRDAVQAAITIAANESRA